MKTVIKKWLYYHNVAYKWFQHKQNGHPLLEPDTVAAYCEFEINSLRIISKDLRETEKNTSTSRTRNRLICDFQLYREVTDSKRQITLN